MMLFCLPYAGGSEEMYFKWEKYLHPLIKLYPVPLKGRGKRFNEAFYESLEDAVDDIFEFIDSKISDDDYAIYGHNMGGLLAYELYYKIMDKNRKVPKHIFISGHKAPNIANDREKIHTLSDDEFLKKIIEYGGINDEAIENGELLEGFLPIIRNDFKIIENYNYIKREDKINCNITLFTGDEDFITFHEMIEWENYANKDLRIHTFNGNHFFINNNIEGITSIINNILKNESICNAVNYFTF